MKLFVTKRRSLTPLAGMPPVTPGAHAMRRSAERKEMTERVTLRAAGGAIHEGWALNGSRGGLRAILEANDNAKGAKDAHDAKGGAKGAKAGRVELGSEVQVVVGEGASAVARRARVVWLQEEPDGVVVGLEFMSISGFHRGIAPPAPEGAAVAPPSADPPPSEGMPVSSKQRPETD